MPMTSALLSPEGKGSLGEPPVSGPLQDSLWERRLGDIYPTERGMGYSSWDWLR